MLYEAEIAGGLADIACADIDSIIGTDGAVAGQHRMSEVPFSYYGDPSRLLQLRTVIAVYAIRRFAVPRPKALLGHQHFTALIDHLRLVLSIIGRDKFDTFHLSAAGSDSAVMTRIKQDIVQSLGLTLAQAEGDLVLRLRPTPRMSHSWDALVRLTPRPLSARPWRVCNMQGALNASVASAMIHLTQPTPQDTFLNVACGSGTIMIERLAYSPAQRVIGCDISLEALACATQNLVASGQTGAEWVLCDGVNLPLPDNSVNKLCADLPFGQLVGSHGENRWLYAELLSEAARVAQPGARFVIITHEVRLTEQVLAAQDSWQIREVRMVALGGLHPRIFVLERRSS